MKINGKNGQFTEKEIQRVKGMQMKTRDAIFYPLIGKY